uniref:Ig-like domain-containing protein n=1 Tax=Takifugu rubripes TaxID=31033 RepID=H2SE29_TAKRU
HKPVMSICTFKGSSVDISCHYDERISSSFWYRFEVPPHHRDLTADPQYGGRVEVFSPIGSSTLRIKDLKKNDSANYRFKITNAPTVPLVTMSPPGGAVQNSSVNLTCHSDANPEAKYAWFRANQMLVSEESQLFIKSLQASDCGEYYCTAENHLLSSPDAPKSCSVSVSPSAVVAENTTVTLSCSSDANPAANYSWYKENQTLTHQQEGVYRFTSIRSEDGGIYHCRSENQYGEINSTEPPDTLRAHLSVSSPGEVEEDTTVTLRCSSDANPAANYSWYKEGENSPKSSEQNFTITHVRAEDSGHYSLNVFRQQM